MKNLKKLIAERISLKEIEREIQQQIKDIDSKLMAHEDQLQKVGAMTLDGVTYRPMVIHQQREVVDQNTVKESLLSSGVPAKLVSKAWADGTEVKEVKFFQVKKVNGGK